jgi:hypothetical protein
LACNESKLKVNTKYTILSSNSDLLAKYRSMYRYKLNIAVKWLVLLLHVWEGLCSNLGPETLYPVQAFLWFSSVPPGKCQNSAFIPDGGDTFLQNVGNHL